MCVYLAFEESILIAAIDRGTPMPNFFVKSKYVCEKKRNVFKHTNTSLNNI